jgi:adenosylhomocysteine nucleosidase
VDRSNFTQAKACAYKDFINIHLRYRGIGMKLFSYCKYALLLNIVAICLFGGFSGIASAAPKQPLYAIITPMPSEASYIRQHIENPQKVKNSEIEYIIGTINNHKVVSVVSGYGKVNVTAVASRVMASLHPDMVILAETAGAVNQQLPIGTVVVGTQVFAADFGKLTVHGPELPFLIDNPVNNKKEPLIFVANKQLLRAAATVATGNKFDFPVKFGTLADEDTIPDPESQLNLMRANNVQAVSMDGAPVAKLGWIFNTPCLVIHSIANIAGQEITDQGTILAANNTAKFVLKLISVLP